MPPPESSRRSSSQRPRNRDRERERDRDRRKNGQRKRKSQSSRRPVSESEDNRDRKSRTLSANALADLERENARQKKRSERASRAYRDESRKPGRSDDHRRRERDRDPDKPRTHGKNKKRRVVSGAVMEEGQAKTHIRGGWGSVDSVEQEKDFYLNKPPKKNKKKLWIAIGVSVVVLILIIVVAVVVSNKNKGGEGGDKKSASDDSADDTSALNGKDHSEIPEKWQGTYLDPWSWKSTTDFNLTFTDEMVGDLPIMGLYDDWDDSAQANENVPPLNKPWGSYAKQPARGVCIGGWLYLEPFITPSLFNYDTKEGVIDEWTLLEKLGSDGAKTMEKHYASFVTEQTFKDIQAAGLDHVRIGFNYWAVEIYDGDPYVYRTSWRYLLRAIEWCRKYGLRVNLDLHGIPGSQNGWNHSGRWGSIGWLNGKDGSKNAQRALDIHDRLSKFFAQPRYKNIITHYGLANEPRMTSLKTSDVISWTENAYKIVRKNGVKALVVFGDGFMGLENWQGLMTGYDDMVLDVHQYVIFNENQIDFTHKKKVEYACDGWTEQAQISMDRSTGYGPTIFAEFSQADTDCAKFLTGVGWGTRWEGTYDTGDKDSSILEPICPTKDNKCSCSSANADPSKWSNEYKKFLKMFAEAQMHSFEKGWGWWYWTWKTENNHQWSYESGLKAGVLPAKPWKRDFNCDKDVPDFEKEGLPEYL
ncbi:glucan 1,3-beta-glucosidase [Fusarium heterosporum]|uniref:glucan 1,3-beta-glucosidase n=1 Tax=Fusarium heterosporum TaxID=42747 RepID=A0A8H5SVZ1_FUSHE|nr:glucan 1,3-beta-glucosidase [Fusarium heterosporum]